MTNTMSTLPQPLGGVVPSPVSPPATSSFSPPSLEEVSPPSVAESVGSDAESVCPLEVVTVPPIPLKEEDEPLSLSPPPAQAMSEPSPTREHRAIQVRVRMVELYPTASASWRAAGILSAP